MPTKTIESAMIHAWRIKDGLFQRVTSKPLSELPPADKRERLTDQELSLGFGIPFAVLDTLAKNKYGLTIMKVGKETWIVSAASLGEENGLNEDHLRAQEYLSLLERLTSDKEVFADEELQKLQKKAVRIFDSIPWGMQETLKKSGLHPHTVFTTPQHS